MNYFQIFTGGAAGSKFENYAGRLLLSAKRICVNSWRSLCLNFKFFVEKLYLVAHHAKDKHAKDQNYQH